MAVFAVALLSGFITGLVLASVSGYILRSRIKRWMLRRRTH